MSWTDFHLACLYVFVIALSWGLWVLSGAIKQLQDLKAEELQKQIENLESKLTHSQTFQ